MGKLTVRISYKILEELNRISNVFQALTIFCSAKNNASKWSSIHSLLDLFCRVASWSIFCSMRFERAMLTGCLRIR